AGAGVAAPASGSAAKAGGHVGMGGALRVYTQSDFDFIDPALDYCSHGWNVQYATDCKLLNFPDKEATAGGTRITPEVATSLPAVSSNGKTYTFNLKKTYKFADGSGVAAANFAYAFNRDLQPKMSSPATTFEEDILGAKAVEAGTAGSASGIKVLSKYKLRIPLTHVAPDFLARVTEPFFAALRPGTPAHPRGITPRA